MWRTDRWTDRHRHRTATMCDNSGRWDAVLLRHIDLPCRSFRHSGTRKCSDVINAWLPTCRTHLIQSISKHAWQFVLYKSIFCNQRRLTNYKILRHMTWHMTWHDMAWHDMTYDTTWHDMTYDMTHDMTWHMTWQSCQVLINNKYTKRRHVQLEPAPNNSSNKKIIISWAI